MIEFAIGFLFGVLVFYIMLRMVINDVRQQLERLLSNVLESESDSESDLIKIEDAIEPETKNINSINTRLEEVNGVFYVYNIDNGEFIAQGATADEVQKHAQSRISNKDVFIVQGDSDAIERYRNTNSAT
jgi:hypothetical protein